MINFVNNGTDERILKSLDVENPSEDLIKAMNKQGMVQKEVQVKGKHGTFTRKQWVKAGEEQKSDKPVQAKTDATKPVGSTPKTNTIQSQQSIKPDIKKQYEITSTDGAKRTIANVIWNDTRNIYQYNEVFDNGTVGKMEHTMTEKEWKTAKEINKPQSTQKPTGQKSDTKQKANYFKATQATKDKVNELGNKMGNDKLLEYAKQNGVTWSEHSHNGINIMRAKMALAQAIQEGKIDPDDKSAGTPSSSSDKSSDGKTGAPSHNIPLKKDSYGGETWYEGTINGHRARLLQETAGDSSWWNIEKDGKFVEDDNGKAMSFDNIQDAYDELKNACSANGEYKNISIQKFDSYNERRYSKPWVAIVDSDGKLDFSKDVGFYSGKPGESGELIVSKPQEGQVYAFGQKDSRGNNGGYSYVRFTDGKFMPIDKSDLLQHLSGSSSKSIQKFDSYNERRYGVPWVAKVNAQGKPDFNEKVGKYTGQPGESGELYVFEPQENQIYMFGQKDYRGNSSMSEYVIFENGAFRNLDKSEVSKYLNSGVNKTSS